MPKSSRPAKKQKFSNPGNGSSAYGHASCRPCRRRQDLRGTPDCDSDAPQLLFGRSADVPTAEKLVQVFARAREHTPSILLIDEMDGLLPRGDSRYYIGQHQVQFVEQALVLMDAEGRSPG